MCGICGIINQDESKINKSQIEEINNISKHRGPDAEGYFLHKNLAFGHRRLSIIDLSDQGKQPLEFLDRYVITYNGEIYNYLELKQELISLGYHFDSETDTEVILAAYDQWGHQAVSKFNGMWAFAIYDRKKQEIFCSRDRFGIKPFYFSEFNSSFVFGSEIKQILAFTGQKYANTKIVLDYLIFGFEEHSDKTFFHGINKLQPSSNLIYSLKDHKFSIQKYFHLKESQKQTPQNLKAQTSSLKEELLKSIQLRLRSDVKVGTCLSGGLDSSIIANYASKLYEDDNLNQFNAIHSKSIETETDESFFAKIVAEHANLNLNVITPSIVDIDQILDEVIYTQEEPFGGPSVVMQYFVMKKAKNINCKVLLDGQGGDEVFVGYERYHSYYLCFLLSKGRLLAFTKYLYSLKSFKVSKSKIIIRALLALFPNLFWNLLFYRSQRYFGLNVPYKFNDIKNTYTFSSINHVQINELERFNLTKLLRYEDRNSMRHSVETRLPYLDYNLVLKSLQVDPGLKLKKGYLKYILRELSDKDLPDNIIWRTNKFGFEAPTKTWIRSNKQEMMNQIKKSNILNELLSIKGEIYQNDMLLWRFFSVAKWEKMYNIEGHKN